MRWRTVGLQDVVEEAELRPSLTVGAAREGDWGLKVLTVRDLPHWSVGLQMVVNAEIATDT
jgi:hypothetical protein